METRLIKWLNLLVRWIHIIVGIAWINASSYFVWLESNLNRSNPREGLSGDLWTIHNGGICHLEKYELTPPKMPENLHWFKWEAYSIWTSGAVLLTIVLYLNPTFHLIAPDSDLAPAAAVAIGIGSLVCSWFVYTILCDSALGKAPALLGLVLFVLLVAAAYGLTRVLNGRGTCLHVGAIIGIIMVGNVFKVIMSAQRALAKTVEENREPDPVLLARGLLRSRHNNYFTLPVLFTMISNHFPSTYGGQYDWLILATIAVLTVLIRCYLNAHHESSRLAWALPAGAPGMIALVFATMPNYQQASAPLAGTPVAAPVQPTIGGDAPATPAAPQVSNAGTTSGAGFDRVHHMIQKRCTIYYPAKPTSQLLNIAPGGIMLDTLQRIQQLAPKIRAQAVASQTMPLGNITQIAQEGRSLIGSWIAKGVQIN